MTQAMTKTEGNVPAVGGPPEALRGMVASDVLVPQLLLMQGTSDFVHEGKSVPGKIVKSTTIEEVGNPTTKVAFIPLTLPVATWIIEVRAPGAKRGEFRRTEPRHAGNDMLAWDYPANADGDQVVEGSKEHTHEGKRTKCLSLYAVLPADIDAEAAEMKKAEAGEAPDLSKALTPVLIRFRSTGFKAGREVISFFSQAERFKQKAYHYILQLSCHQESNDDGTFYVYDVDRNAPKLVAPEHKPMVEQWAALASGSNLKVDETGDSGAEPAAAGGSKGLY